MLIPLGFLAASSSSAGSFDLLETTVLTGSQASVEFTNLISKYSSSYEHFQIRAVARSTAAEVLTGLRVRLGTTSIDSGNNYASHQLYGYNGSVASQNSTSVSWIFGAAVAGGNAGSSIFGASVVDLLDPFSTNKNKTGRTLGGVSAGTGTSAYVALESGAWFNTAAVQQIAVLPASGSWATYSRFSLYGLKAA